MERFTTVLTVGLLMVYPTAWAGEPPEVEVLDAGVSIRKISSPGHEGHEHASQDIMLRNDLVGYRVRYCACVDKAHAPLVAPVEGYVGMPQPASCNWYHSGFLRILIDGEDVGKYPLADFSALDSGERGLCRMVWEYPGGRVRLSFVLDPGDRGLKTQILLSPKQPPKSVVVSLNCYPSFFTSHYKRQGARKIVTPGGEVKEGARLAGPAVEHWWALYKDDVFDVARGEGEGPCAMLLIPAQAETVDFAPGGYAVGTTITFKADQSDLRLAFWDFKGMTNAEALDYMKEHAGQTLAALLNTSFRPLLVEELDLAAERAELDRLAAAVGESDALREERKVLAEAEQALLAAREGDWRSEKQLAELVRRYRDNLWELKIEALFAQ